MKSILLSALATYIIFIVVDFICCPALYQKIFYRACFDIFEDETKAEIVSLSMSKDFTRFCAFIPIIHIIIFIAAFMNSALYIIEKSAYSKVIANRDVILDNFSDKK